MDGRAVIFIESNTSGTGQTFVRTAGEMGFVPVLVTTKPERYAFAAGEPGLRVMSVADTADADALHRALADAFGGGAGIAAVTSSSEYSIPVAAALARRLGLPGPDPDAIERCRDKGYQRTRLHAAGVGVPPFREADSVPSAVEAARALGWPVVVKPVDGSGSVGVRLCEDESAVAAHAGALLARGANERGIAPAPRLLVEALARGAEFSVETFSGRVIGITRKHLGALPDFVETGHDYPACAAPEEERALVDAVLRGTEALGLGWGPQHWELRVEGDRAAVIEVNPRLAGGFIPELVRRAQGIDLVRATLELATGGAPDVAAKAARFASIRFLLSPGDGTLGAPSGLDDAAAVPGVEEVRMYKAPGDAVVRAGDFRDRVGHVVAGADTPEAARAAAEAGRDAVRLHLQPEAAAAPATAA